MKINPIGSSIYEQTIISIIRGLPQDRVIQLIDFAKFLESQSIINKIDEEKSKEKKRISEEKWDKLFAEPEAKHIMREMAYEALEDYHAGKTTEIKTSEDGRLEPA
ncbi:hypothetical protein QUF70_06375 [Desulfobacterales bacterium HSG17]|nr:hypothetical protein [Desulfobacterales bacterium HSG17]